MSYAENTSVSVEKSRHEIESTLQKYGAGRFAYMCGDNDASIAFELSGKLVRFDLPLPNKSEKRFHQTAHRRNQRTQEEAYRLWEQACRSRWRALFISIKAKLEACEVGITTFESEFLAHFVMPNGKTLGSQVIPQLEEMKTNGTAPRLQLGLL